MHLEKAAAADKLLGPAAETKLTHTHADRPDLDQLLQIYEGA